MNSSHFQAIHSDLLLWYRYKARRLPWRNIENPYLTWISEVMLQQTQVETVIPYFHKWSREFPNIEDLQRCSEEDVLKIWEGLGYYSRARNIKKTADILVSDYNGKLPENLAALRKLPGIGEYIAAAICSIAFGQMVPALEANGIRVIARLLDCHEEVSRTKTKLAFKGYLTQIIEFGEAGSLNQAVMDLGSLICLPKNPICKECPIKDHCLAFKNNTQNILPIKKQKNPIPHVIVVAAVIRVDSKVLITKRLPNKLLGGLWEFPGGKVEEGESYQAALKREIYEEIGVEIVVGKSLGEYQHAYTHFSVTVHTYIAQITTGIIQKLEVADYAWMDIDQLDQVPMGKVDRQISMDIQAEISM
jgi:A/G-specific adenine glycosylase